MAPTPQEPVVEMASGPELDGDRVVISGMSGLYPSSHHIKEFEEVLYSKKNPVTTDKCRWTFNHPEVSNFTGKTPDLDRFDAQFFKVHYRLANCMDTLGRKALEQAFQAIYDAGLSPEQLSGRKVGVYIGSCFSETEKAFVYTSSLGGGFGVTGCNRSMFANRVSYWLNAKGPSMAVDASDCSGIAAMEQALIAIQRGDCEAALIGACNICLHPQSSVHYARIITMCKDGKTKSFDEHADGCAKSEAVNMLLLQKAKDAKRVYAELIHAKCKFSEMLTTETGMRFGFYRDPAVFAEFLDEFYMQARVPPSAVEYVEAFGSAVPEADKEELEAIEKVFLKGRRDPLKIGSVMSNIGYTEAASGISAVTKVLLAYHRGELAANLHCSTPRQDVTALREGRMQVVTEHSPLSRSSYVGVNSIAVTGLNGHALLKGYYKQKDLNRYKCNYPRLVTISGRQDENLQKFLDNFKGRPIDPEEIALFHNIHKYRIPGHLGRGYIILDTDEEQKTVALAEAAAYYDDTKRPLWFVYSGMGSQWAGMGAQLMRIPIFSAAIERCRRALEPKGIDIVHIITSTDKAIFDNILNSFVGIAAIQIGLTDVLKAIGLEPDNVIGHSVGELGCAYADGCFTAEEMILAAYSRGLVSVQTPFIHGSMAAVGLGYEKIAEMIPPEIEVACHNSAESSTISGPSDIMKEFVAKLTADGIFAKEVPCSNIAYHSRYIAEAGPGLLKYLSEVIKDPKERSEKWVSTSVPQERWGEPIAKYSSAEYHTNNLLNPVLFEETAKLIPANAVLVEIAPHGLLQAILKRAMPSCRHLPLTRRGHPDNVLMVLDAIGKLFVDGFNLDIAAIYPKVEFPVSTSTPMLSHLVDWAHHEKWNLPLFDKGLLAKTSVCEFKISLFDEEHSYLSGHVLRGKNVVPYAAVIVAVWDTLAMTQGAERKRLPVELRGLRMRAQPPLLSKRPLRLRVMLNRGSGGFEVTSDNTFVLSGNISKQFADDVRHFDDALESAERYDFDSKDIYQLLLERDHHYEGDFRSIHKANSSFSEAQIAWTNNWVTLLDGVIQMNALRQPHDSISLPSYIRRLVLDHTKLNEKTLIKEQDESFLLAQVSETFDYTRCGGILMEGARYKNIGALKEPPVNLQTVKFVPHFDAQINAISAWKVQLQIVAENINKDVINIVTIKNQTKDATSFNDVKTAFNEIPGITVNYNETSAEKVMTLKESFLTDIDLVLVHNLSLDEFMCQMLYRVLKRDSFVINQEETINDRIRPSALYSVVSAHNVGHTKLELLNWRPTQNTSASTVVSVRTSSDLELLSTSRKSLPARNKLVILSPYPPVPGLKELVKEWRKETDQSIHLVSITEEDNLDQLPEIHLAFTVLNKGVWGSDYYLPCPEAATVQNRIVLQSAQIGDVSSLYWAESAPLQRSNLIVKVHYAGLNNMDVKKATGVVPFQIDDPFKNTYAMDFSGVTESGARVMGLVKSGAAASSVAAVRELLWPVPQHWTLEDAATVPYAYAHAYYILTMKVELRSMHSILVCGGAGALGQALLAVALAMGCDVYTTVSDLAKKRFLLRLFPQLKEDHIFNSRTITFVDDLFTMTNGVGVNIAITGAPGQEAKDAVLKVVSYIGITVDVDQVRSGDPIDLNMNALTTERNYVRSDFCSIFNDVNTLKKLQSMVSEGITRGIVRPLTRVTLRASDAARATRLLATSGHRGRVLLKLQQDAVQPLPRLTCSPGLSHVVICADEVTGVQLADRLVHRGAQKLILHIAKSSGYLRFRTRYWEKLGAQVETVSGELDTKGVVNLLTAGNTIAPVEGIYVTVGANVSLADAEKWLTVLTNLDLASRKMCPSLRYFAVVSAGSIGRKTCLTRSRLGLPATSLDLHAMFQPSDPSTERASWRAVIDAADRAVRSAQSDLVGFPPKVAPKSLIQQIAELAEIQLTEDENAIYVVNPARIRDIAQFLQDVHNVGIEEDELAVLTLAKLRTIQEHVTDVVRSDVHGLKTFYSCEHSDELKGTIPVVPLPTLVQREPEGYDEFDVSRQLIIIVPGLEGHHSRFRLMCERLKAGAVVLQPGLDSPDDTIRQTAEKYVQIMKDKVNLNDNFYLVGYESGVLVALEAAAIMEEYGLKGTVFCVAGSPEEVQATIRHQLSAYQTDEQLQDAVIRHMFVLMKGDDDGLDEVLEKVSTWEEKVNVCVRLLLGRVPHSAQYARSLIVSAYKRIQIALNHSPTQRQLNSKIVCLRSPSMLCENGTPSSLLQKYSKQPVIVHELEEPLGYCTLDLRIPSIINKYLDKDLIETYEKANLCEDCRILADLFRGSHDEDLS